MNSYESTRQLIKARAADARTKRTTGKCPSCRYRHPLRKDGRLISHQIAYNTPCSGSGMEPEVGTPLDAPS